VLKNEGFVTKSDSFLDENDHYCPDCNDRTKKTFYVVGGYGEEYLGSIGAWGIVNARQVAWDKFERSNMVYRGKEEAKAKIEESGS
jgi:hypothetical protein